MNDNENSNQDEKNPELPNLDDYSEDNMEINDKSDENEQEEHDTEKKIEKNFEVKKAKTTGSIEDDKEENEFTPQEIGSYHSVQGNNHDIDLFDFSSKKEKKFRKYSVEQSTEKSYYSGVINYLALRNDLSQRRRLMEEIEFEVGEPEKKKGDNYLYFHAYKISVIKEGEKIWMVHRR